MARPPQDKAQAALETAEYFVIDKRATSIAGQKVNNKTKTVTLTDSQASFYLASGSISAEDPAADKGAAKAVDKHNKGG